MTRHLGVSVFLSVAIVVFFAIALYEPERPRVHAPVAERPASVRDEPTATPVAAVHPEATSPAPDPSRAPLQPDPRAPAIARSASKGKSIAFRALPRRATSKTASPATPRSERAAFIHADAGETVADVAVRVYGSPDAARALWMANRDILPSRDARLSAGTVLRTP